MKVLQVNCVYNKGSTGKITADIHHELLRRGIESIVCYGRGKKCDEPYVYKTCGEFYSHVQHFIANLTGVMYGGCWYSTQKLISIIKREKPDVVHLQCINGYFVNIYHLVDWLKKNHVKTVLTLHAEFMHTANCGHALDCNGWKTGCGHCPRMKQETGSYFLDGTARSWRKMEKAFDGFENDLTVVSVSPWLRDRAKQSPILADKQHEVILNGLDTEIFHIHDALDEKKQYASSEEKIVFQATPYFSLDPDHIKGGYYLNHLAKQMPGVKFIVAGSYDQSISVAENVTLLGSISDQEKLANLYSMADLTLLTSQKETFSMVTAESLCCGTPVVGFKAGAPEQIAIENFSAFSDFGNVELLRNNVEVFLYRKDICQAEIERQAHVLYSKRTMCRQYVQLYQKILNG